LAPVAGLALVVAAACTVETEEDDDGTTTGTGGVDDGKLHPEPNGVRISETEACEAMHDAVESAAQLMNCPKTLRPCPNFLRAQAPYPTDCAQYDEGSVQGCVDHWTGITNGCDLLDETDCVATYYPEEAPAGCP
jgi:hypothetical protein